MDEPSGHPIGNEQSITDCKMKSRDHLHGNIFVRGFRKPRENRIRWYILFAVTLLLISMAVIAITLAIYFGTGNDYQDPNVGHVETIHLGPHTKLTTGKPNTREQFITKLTHPSTSHTATSQVDETSSFAATTSFHTDEHMHKLTTKSSSSDPTSNGQTTGSGYTAGKTTPDHISKGSSQATSSRSQVTTGHHSTEVTKSTDHSADTATEYPLRPVLYVESNDIILPYSKAEVQIDCVTMYARQWKKMIIYRQLEDSITRLLEVNSNMGSPNVDVNVNFTSEISYKEDALQATIRSKEVDCSYVGNYTCLLVLPQESYKNTTSVHAVNHKESKPTLTISTSVVEDSTVTITCSMELIEPNVTIGFKFRPPGLDKYFNLSLTPNITRTWTGCSLLIESTLTMVSKMHDNGSVFMCDVTTHRNDGITTYSSEAEFHVIPKTYCDDKNAYAIYPHPYETCNSVVYCYVTGPQVYKINCGAGYCYDTTKTNCVKVGSSTESTTASVSTTTQAEDHSTGSSSRSEGT
ncbi:uncharacterized protein LOC125650480 isoform X2 [Ostrea edulis]|uniref:uncharacterized protein LOC125650480 isoform X2 n=1 Tax=Ostrea edulis TaxID=37623 RepID=UPI0020951274|nr:uncharacterized protein LOC125650480 isoform X2 [Ostrea edulis]